MRGLGKSMVVDLFEKLRIQMKNQPNLRVFTKNKYLEKENGKTITLQISPKIESLYGLPRKAPKL